MTRHLFIYILHLSLIYFSSICCYGESLNFIFSKPQGIDQLPNNNVLAMIQDSDNYIWIATKGGLCKYDGFELKNYCSNIYNPELLTHNWISAIQEGPDKKIYIGTKNGFNILDKKSGKIQTYNEGILANNLIADIEFTSDGQLLLSTNKGVIIFDEKTGECSKFNNKKISKNAFKGMLTDSKGYTWVGSWDKGLYRYSPKTKEWIKYPQLSPKNSAHTLFEDSKGRLWVGTFGDGLLLIENQYDINNLKIKKFIKSDKNNISDNYIYAIIENKSWDCIFIGTRTGLSVAKLQDNQADSKWHNYYTENNPNSLHGNNVDALFNDKQNNLWVGTTNGIRIITNHLDGFENYPMNECLKTTKTNDVNSIIVDKNKNIWTGIRSIGLVNYRKDNKSQFFQCKEGDSKFTVISKMLEIKDNGNLLLGTFDGLFLKTGNQIKKIKQNDIKIQNIYNIQEIPNKGYLITGTNTLGILSKDLKSFSPLSHNLPKGTFVSSIQQNNTYLIATLSNGIFKLSNIQGTNIDNIKAYNIDNKKLGTNSVNQVFCDSQGRIWAATNGAGLAKYDQETDSFISINQIKYFPTDVIFSIEEDNEGNLWCGSNIGLIKIYPTENINQIQFKIYDEYNDLTSNYFNPRSSFKDSDGKMYFGTNKGFVSFYPEKVISSNYFPNLGITNIYVDNIPINKLTPKDKNKITSLPEEYTKQLFIPNKYRSFSLTFSPLVYTMPYKIRYAYKLEGFDKDWQYTDSYHRTIHYSNLEGGKYKLLLKCTNESGLWGYFTKKINIKVEPKPWKSWWAYVIYILTFLITLRIYLSIIKQRLKLKNEILLQKKENENNIKLNQAKLKFFTNITHELFTPISIVSIAAENVKDNIPEKEFKVMKTNIIRLTRLIQQILEFRKSNTGNLKLLVVKKDMPTFFKNNIEGFEPLMNNKEISVTYSCNVDHKNVYFDPDKIDKILYNLLSNALKYNRAGAKVEIDLQFSKDDKFATFTVKDNGNGLTEKSERNLFKRFYDGDFRQFNTSGTGIGLSLVKDLVTLHKGKISVDNRPGEGVAFTISIPVDREMYSKGEIDEHLQIKTKDTSINASKNNTVNSILNSKDKVKNPTNDSKNIEGNIEENIEKKYKIMIVEDNSDMNFILQNALSKKYEVYSANNGKTALELAHKVNVDLIISDVMMPEMNGYELCKTIKNNINLNHIPIILLTAKQEEEDIVTGYESGANAYIPKPFTLKRLYSRINNLIEAREKRIEQFKTNSNITQDININNIDYTAPDEEFLKKVFNLINENYSDSSFDQNALMDKVGVSKSTLHRKLTSLTGTTAANLIKDTRLKAAYKILQEKEGSMIAEVAFAVGYNDPKYFSTCFKKKFGVAPSEMNS